MENLFSTTWYYCGGMVMNQRNKLVGGLTTFILTAVLFASAVLFRTTDTIESTDFQDAYETVFFAELTPNTEYVQQTMCMSDSLKEISIFFANYSNRANSGQVSITVSSGGGTIGSATLDAASIGDGVFCSVPITHSPAMGDMLEIRVASDSPSGQAVTVGAHVNEALTQRGATLTVGGQEQPGYHLNLIQTYTSPQLSMAFWLAALLAFVAYFATGTPQALYSDLLRSGKWKKISLYGSMLLIAWLVISLRNPQFISTPIVYGEDGTFLSRQMQEGFWSTLFSSRSGGGADFPNTASYILLGLASQTTFLLNGYDLSTFPFWNGVYANLLIAFSAVLGYVVFERLQCKKVGILAYLSMIFVNLNSSSAEVFGRSLNTQFLWVVITAYVLILLYERKQAISVWSILGFLLCFIAVYTFPICYAQIAGYLFFVALRGIRNRALKREVFANGIFLLLLMTGVYQLPSLMASEGAAAEFTYKAESTVEFFITRHFLYAFVGYFYQFLNDGATLFLFAIYLFFAGYAFIIKYKEEGTFLNSYTLFMLLVLGTCFSSAWTRRTMTAIFDGYTSTYPDRYYYACNILAAVLFYYALYLVLSKYHAKSSVKYAVMGCLMTMTLLNPHLFYFTKPNYWAEVTRFDRVESLADRCAVALKEDSSDGFTCAVDIYPADWSMVLELPYVIKTAEEGR